MWRHVTIYHCRVSFRQKSLPSKPVSHAALHTRLLLPLLPLLPFLLRSPTEFPTKSLLTFVSVYKDQPVDFALSWDTPSTLTAFVIIAIMMIRCQQQRSWKDGASTRFLLCCAGFQFIFLFLKYVYGSSKYIGKEHIQIQPFISLLLRHISNFPEQTLVFGVFKEEGGKCFSTFQTRNKRCGMKDEL